MSADRETTISKWSASLQVKWKLQAQRAQIYECKPIKSGALASQFREPIATLIDGATSVGQHSAGPKWLVDGVTIAVKIVDSESEQTPADISQLKPVVTNPESSGVLAVLRLETKGGQLEGAASRPARFEPSPIPLNTSSWRNEFSGKQALGETGHKR